MLSLGGGNGRRIVFPPGMLPETPATHVARQLLHPVGVAPEFRVRDGMDPTGDLMLQAPTKQADLTEAMHQQAPMLGSQV